MTVDNCVMMLEQAKAKDDKVEIEMLEARIVRKLAHPRNANHPLNNKTAKPEVKSGKK